MNNRNLIAVLAVVALLTITATTAGCATNTTPAPTPLAVNSTTVGNNTTFTSGAGFSITYPKNLTADSTTNASSPAKVIIYLNHANTLVTQVNVVTQPLATGQNQNDFVAFNLKELNNASSSGLYKNLTILNETNLTFAGKPAHQILFSAIVPQQYSPGNATNVSIKTTQIWLINNNTGYNVAYKAVANQYDTYLAQAQRIMNSFVLT
jgi:hypothetical protein